jgi:hypothetical protein
MLTCFTREEYNCMLCARDPLPQQFIRMEEDGTSVLVTLPSGEPSTPENPRMKNPIVRDAVNWLVDLLEYYYVDQKEQPKETPFSNMLQCQDVYSLKHVTEMDEMIKTGLLRVETWLEVRKPDDHDDLVPLAKNSVSVLRKCGF